jgi:hypothetical protein
VLRPTRPAAARTGRATIARSSTSPATASSTGLVVAPRVVLDLGAGDGVLARPGLITIVARELMTPPEAARFDVAVREIVESHETSGGALAMEITASITWAGLSNPR